MNCTFRNVLAEISMKCLKSTNIDEIASNTT